MIEKSKLIAQMKELNEQAAHLHPLPDGLEPPQQMYFLSLRLIYREYNANQLPKEQALKEKQALDKACINAAYTYDLYKWQAKHEQTFQKHFSDLQHGCEVCHKLEKILNGLIEEE